MNYDYADVMKEFDKYNLSYPEIETLLVKRDNSSGSLQKEEGRPKK